MIILDSDVVSEAMREDKAIFAWLNRQSRSSVWTTAVTVFEIRSGLAVMVAGRRRSALEAAFARLIHTAMENRILAFDQPAAEAAALLSATRHRAGRPRDARDTMIAGIALANRATLATRNLRHFDDLNIPVVDPWRAKA